MINIIIIIHVHVIPVSTNNSIAINVIVAITITTAAAAAIAASFTIIRSKIGEPRNGSERIIIRGKEGVIALSWIEHRRKIGSAGRVQTQQQGNVIHTRIVFALLERQCMQILENRIIGRNDSKMSTRSAKEQDGKEPLKIIHISTFGFGFEFPV